MVRRAIFVLVVAALHPGTSAAQAPAAPQSGVVSPEIGPDRRVTFRLVAPGAMQAAVTALAASPSQGAVSGLTLPMHAEGDVWVAVSEPLAPDIYSYQFTVDGRTFNDPSNGRVIEEFSGARTSAFAVPGALWTTPAARAGALHTHRYRSDALGTDEHYVVYTPPDYEASGAALPVLYLLHGMGDTAATWVTNGGVNVTLDNLLAVRQAVPMLVVMPLGYGGASGADLTAFEPFERALLEEIIPQVEKAYRVAAGRDARAVAGVSMGGSQAMSLALRHPDMFAWAGSFSGAFQMGARQHLADVRGPIGPVRYALIFAGWGSADQLAPVNRQFVAGLKARSAIAITMEEPGVGHVWPLWRQLAAELLRLLFRTSVR